MADGPVPRFALDHLRPRNSVVVRLGASGPLQLFGHETDRVIALAMHHHEGAATARRIEDFEQLAVVEHRQFFDRSEPRGG